MAHLPAPIARVRQALRDFLTARFDDGVLEPGDLLLAACSGGADSVALASQLAFLAPRLGLRGGLVTVDHGMQAGSAQQAERVVRLGERLGLSPVISRAVISGTHRVPKDLGPEGAARELRFAALARAQEETAARAVLLGHTMEDQAETVLLGLSRGAGTRAVAGMPAMRGPLWRPLLSVRRAHTEGACEELDLPTWQDPTNAPDGPWRTATGEALPRAALRHTVLPELARALGQDPIPALARTGELARYDSDFLHNAAREHFPLITPVTDTKGEKDAPPEGAVVALDVAAANELAEPLRWRVLREFVIRAGAPEEQVSMRHVRAVDTLLTDWRGQRGVSVPGGHQVVRLCGRLYVVTPPDLERA